LTVNNKNTLNLITLLVDYIDLLKENNVYLNIEKEDVEQALDTARKVI